MTTKSDFELRAAPPQPPAPRCFTAADLRHCVEILREVGHCEGSNPSFVVLDPKGEYDLIAVVEQAAENLERIEKAVSEGLDDRSDSIVCAMLSWLQPAVGQVFRCNCGGGH